MTIIFANHCKINRFAIIILVNVNMHISFLLYSTIGMLINKHSHHFQLQSIVFIRILIYSLSITVPFNLHIFYHGKITINSPWRIIYSICKCIVNYL